MKTDSFKKGMRVRDIPPHLKSSFSKVMKDPQAVIDHKTCGDGVVSSVNERLVFVKYDLLSPEAPGYIVMKTGDEPYTPKATKPGDLLQYDIIVT